MRLKSAALFAVSFLFVSFWLHGGARCQSSLAPPLSLAPPPSVTNKDSPPAATSNPSPGVADPWENVRRHGTTAKGSPPPPPTVPEVPMSPPPVILASPPLVTDDVPPRTATAKPSARSAAAKNPPPPASAKDAPAPATENVSPSPGIGTLSPSQTPAANYDGFTVGIDDDEETGQPLSIGRRPAKRVRQKPDTTEGPSAIQSLDDSEVEKLKPKLTICRGC